MGSHLARRIERTSDGYTAAVSRYTGDIYSGDIYIGIVIEISTLRIFAG